MTRYLPLLLILLIACSTTPNERYDWGESPWPEIRKERISELLPSAMEAANVDVWIMICRENNNDPIADHIGCENAGGTAAFLFYQDENGFTSKDIGQELFNSWVMSSSAVSSREVICLTFLAWLRPSISFIDGLLVY
jgi:hypothetical protein